MKTKILSAKEIVKKFKIPYHTLNYYTAIGLLPVAGKNGNRREYEESQVKINLERIAKLTREGYPLNLIRKKLTGV